MKIKKNSRYLYSDEDKEELKIPGIVMKIKKNSRYLYCDEDKEEFKIPI